ncbi:MAG: hypothetical protein ABS920_14750 [Sporosarcina sp.]
MPKEEKKPMSDKKTDGLNQTEMHGKEFSDEERQTNEVASTEYTGGGEGKKDLKNDKLETGGF